MANCLISGTLADVNGSRIARASVFARSARADNDVQFRGDLAIGNREYCVTSDENGNFQMSLPQGLEIVIRIDEIGLHKQALVPTEAAATLEELLDANV